jgi:hypothetical protein
LNKQNDEHQYEDLAENGARVGFEEFVDDPECHGSDERAPQVSDTAEHDDHEAVDDVALSQVRRDVVDL